MNKNVPKTHKVRKGIAAVIMNVILSFSPCPVFSRSYGWYILL